MSPGASTWFSGSGGRGLASGPKERRDREFWCGFGGDLGFELGGLGLWGLGFCAVLGDLGVELGVQGFGVSGLRVFWGVG